MKSFRIETPTGQNWSCHGCTKCCRGQMVIELSAEEKKRIEDQGWTEAVGVNPASMIVPEGSGFRLGHKSDGACVFLDETGKCRIHSRFGEAAKPRACRLFPLALHPLGNKLVVGLRFSCPTAVANTGKPLAEQVPDLRRIAEIVVPDNFATIPAPPILRSAQLEWPDFLRFAKWLNQTLTTPNRPVALKLQIALHWLKAVESAEFDQITGQGAEEILEALVRTAVDEIAASPARPEPSRFGKLLFRTLLFGYARKDTVREFKGPGQNRVGMLVAMLRFGSGSGEIPRINSDLGSVPFATLEESFGELSPEAESMLTRFFSVKIQSLHFCGRAYYNYPLIDGFRSLALLFPVILWLARWNAAAEKRLFLATSDIAKAIEMADHHHGYSPLLGTAMARKRVQLLAQRDDIAKLCAAYEE